MFSKHFGCCRFVYNYFLNQKIHKYKNTKTSDNYYKQAIILTKLKKKNKTKWLSEVNSQSLQQTLKDLDTAYQRFFKGTSKFPNFKSKHIKNSFRVPQLGKIINGQLRLPKVKQPIKIKIHRGIEGKIKSMTVSKSATGNYYVSILTEQEIENLPETGNQVGVDVGIKEFLVCSDNTRFENNKYAKRCQSKLKRAQQHLSRKTKGSTSYHRQKIKLAKIHERISDSRLDNLHKTSKILVEENDVICVEDLNIMQMLKTKILAKHIQDASWGKFVELLTYKCEWYGKTLVKIDRFFPSSKMCSNCQYINQDLELRDRTWACSSCSIEHDRDFNAAINVLKEGLRLLSAGTADYTSGENVKPI